MPPGRVGQAREYYLELARLMGDRPSGERPSGGSHPRPAGAGRLARCRGHRLRFRAVPHETPDLAALRQAAAVFNGFRNVDTTWLRLVAETSPALDLAEPAHRTLLLRWLNSWGCRIRYPRDGEPAPFDTGIAAWWHASGAKLPSASLPQLTDADVETIAAVYTELAAVPVGAPPARRTLGPTAAAKALYALRPLTVIPWDAAIAQRLYRGRDGAAFAEHLRLGRAWAQAVIAETGTHPDGREIPALAGRPAVSLAKVLDDYLYVTITLAERGQARKNALGVTADDVREIALSLPRAYEALVRDQVKFRVGQIVFLALSRDETTMGFGYPREERADLIAAEPDKYFWPIPSDMRYQWMRVRLGMIDRDELHEIIVGAWKLCVPKKLWVDYWPVQREPAGHGRRR